MQSRDMVMLVPLASPSRTAKDCPSKVSCCYCGGRQTSGRLFLLLRSRVFKDHGILSLCRPKKPLCVDATPYSEHVVPAFVVRLQREQRLVPEDTAMQCNLT